MLQLNTESYDDCKNFFISYFAVSQIGMILVYDHFQIHKKRYNRTETTSEQISRLAAFSSQTSDF